MKLVTVFAAIVALAAAGAYSPVSTWTLQEISHALSDPATDPAQIPYLEEALNTIMANLMAGSDQTTVVLSLPQSITVNLEEVTAALHDPSTNPAVIPYLETALNELMHAAFAGEIEPTTTLFIPAMTVNIWSLHQLSHAVQDPETDPELLIYVEHALNTLMEQIFAGHAVNTIYVVTPPGVFAEVPVLPEPLPVLPEPSPVEPTPVEPVPVLPTPVEPVPVLPGPTEPMPVFPIGPVNPTPVVPIVPEQVTPVTPEAQVASAPLVQLIINVNANQASAAAPEAVAPTPVAPSPVAVVEGFEPAPVMPVPVIPDVQPTPPIAVGPWVVPEPIELNPTPVIVPPVAVGPWV